MNLRSLPSPARIPKPNTDSSPSAARAAASIVLWSTHWCFSARPSQIAREHLGLWGTVSERSLVFRGAGLKICGIREIVLDGSPRRGIIVEELAEYGVLITR